VFGPGESTKSFTISIVNDQLVEASETFAVGIQNPGSGSLGVPRTVLVTIVDDDSAATISMADMAVSVAESTPTAILTLVRSGSLDQVATINFAASNGSALAGSDYTASSGTVTFAAGQATQTISVPIINDTAPESDESFTITLNNPTGAALGAQSTTTVSILDNDDLALGSLVRQTVVTGLSEPTAIEWTPDGRYMLVAQKGGIVRVVDNGTLRSTPLIDLSSEVNTAGDRGLLGIAINPNFATNPYVYLLYTYDPPETAGQTGAAAPDQDGNRPARLVRVTVNPATMIADPASKVVLLGKNSTWAYTSRPDVNSNGDRSIAPSGIVNGTTITAPADQIEIGTQDNDPDRAGIQNQNIRDYLAGDGDSHSIGAVHFGPDGYLYVTVGDGTSYNFVDPRSMRVQDLHNLSGKLLRIDPATGEGAPDNPYYQASDPNSNQSKVFYYGVRNAYRFSFDPATNLPVLGDVGWTTWEEINTGPPGANFGWPYLEGPGRTGSYQDLPQAITFYNNGNRNNATDQPAVFPIVSRSHGSPHNASAITAGDFYNLNTLIFDDVLNGNIYAATLNASRQVTNIQVVDSGIAGIVDLQKGPDGSLYGADVFDGTIRRWVDSSAASGALGLATPSF
jgi:glucose/arabinose dehydrogenase